MIIEPGILNTPLRQLIGALDYDFLGSFSPIWNERIRPLMHMVKMLSVKGSCFFILESILLYINRTGSSKASRRIVHWSQS